MWYVGYKSCDNLNEYIRTDKGLNIVGYNSLNLIPSFNSD